MRKWIRILVVDAIISGAVAAAAFYYGYRVGRGAGAEEAYRHWADVLNLRPVGDLLPAR